MPAYYNEFEPYAADWLERLIAVGLLPDGDVDRRSILDVRPDDLKGYDQCHFFAGIGGWGLALRLVGWPDDRPVWTGSCPCQPFSVAGQRKGAEDERHLWPVWFDLIRQCRPSVVFGEQVEGAVRHGWLDAVCADMEGEGYAVGAAVLGAHSVGAPHIRQRLWFVADANGRHASAEGLQRSGEHRQQQEDGRAGGSMADADICDKSGNARSGRTGVFSSDSGRGRAFKTDGRSASGSMANGHDEGLEVGREQPSRGEREAVERGGAADELADAMHTGRAEGWAGAGHRQVAGGGELDRVAHANLIGHDWCGPRGAGRDELAHDSWSDLEWLPCRDGKARPTQSGLFPLAHGIPGRVGRLRAYGNAIVPQVAAEFIAAYLDCRE